MLIQSSGVPDDLNQVLAGLPVPINQASQRLVLVMADRFNRDSDALSQWAPDAKRCVEFFEGKQWSEEQLRVMEREQRPALTFNKIAPLIRLVLGYHRNTRSDTRFLPSHDGSGSSEVAEALTKIIKQSATETGQEYVDGEVFMDGILTGRGYYDYRLDFERNDLGEIRARAKDPFSVYPDCEADSYDSREWNRVTESRWVCLDEVEYTYGRPAATMLSGLVHRGGYMGGIPYSLAEFTEELTPWRTFSGANEGDSAAAIHSYMTNCYDPARKNIRLIDTQHYVRVKARCIIDLDTGTRQVVPDAWDEEKVRKVMQWLEDRCWAAGKANPFRLAIRPMKRVRWTTMVGDLIVFDAWSPYESFTIVPYFPYFRRGKTRGAVDDLIDPQMEVNKRRSAQIDIITRTANSGWSYHETSLSEDGKARLESDGAMPGYNMEWRGEREPRRIEPGVPPTSMERLEEKAVADLKEISGINDSALGQLDRVQSGRAIEARQRQSVIAIQTYMDNMTRTKRISGEKLLEMVQQHYTEERTFAILNDNGDHVPISINQREAAGRILNDVTVGKYVVDINETPLSASFLSAQFDELLQMVEKGLLPPAAVMDVAVDISSLPRKDTLKQRVTAIQAASGIPTAEQMGAGMGPVPVGTEPPSQLAASPAQAAGAQGVPIG